MTKKVSSFEIVKHSNYSWSYNYIINGKKRDIHGDSLLDLRRKVLNKSFPWDDQKYPEEDIPKSDYDSVKIAKIPYKKDYSNLYGDETYDYEESQLLRGWNPSMKKWNRNKDKSSRYYDNDEI